MPERCPECNLLGGHLPECSQAPAAPKYTPPNHLRSAAYVILAIAFFYSTPLAILLVVVGSSPGRPMDSVGRTIMVCVIAFIVLLWASSILLILRRRIGVYLWWLCSPIVLLNIPFGTIAAIYVFRKLATPEAERDLESRKQIA